MIKPGIQANGRPAPAGTSGFNLIELLVVIAIVAILAAILFPALAAARLKADQVTCLNNTGQLAQMGLVYQSDYGKGLPFKNEVVGYPRISNTHPADLPNVSICPLAKNWAARDHPDPGTWVLPSQGTAINCWLTLSAEKGQITLYCGSYAGNAWFDIMGGTNSFGTLGYHIINRGSGFPTAASVRYPAQTPLFSDGTWGSVAPAMSDRPGPNLFAAIWLGEPGQTIANVTIARHGSRFPGAPVPSDPMPRTWGINVSFEDGHAGLVKLRDLWTLTWNASWVPSGPPKGFSF
ncbi:MAG: prepilin-type N-terminal cleavage/methylation domain-containing protein [Limisphaerales bacterium]